MVDVTDGADVEVRLVALELLLRHVTCSLLDLARLRRWDWSMTGDGAHNRTRTDDLALTKGVLCQLSYVGPDPLVMVRCEVVGREGIDPHAYGWSTARVTAVLNRPTETRAG